MSALSVTKSTEKISISGNSPNKLIPETSKKRTVNEIIDAACIGDELTSVQSGISNNDVDEETEQIVAVIKKRRRSTLIPTENINSSRNALESEGLLDKSTPTGAENNGRRKSGLMRRSICAIALPKISVQDQVARVLAEQRGTKAPGRVLSQLVDIALRDAAGSFQCSNLTQEQLTAFKGFISLNSEFISDATIKQASENKVTLDKLLTETCFHEKSAQESKSSTDCAVKLQDCNDSFDFQKSNLISEYHKRTQNYKAEYLLWKKLHQERLNAHRAAKRAYQDSCRSKHGSRIDEEQQRHISQGYRSFLSAAPDYQKMLHDLKDCVEIAIDCSADIERGTCRYSQWRAAVQAAGDAAYFALEKETLDPERKSSQTLLEELSEVHAIEVDDFDNIDLTSFAYDMR